MRNICLTTGTRMDSQSEAEQIF